MIVHYKTPSGTITIESKYVPCQGERISLQTDDKTHQRLHVQDVHWIVMQSEVDRVEVECVHLSEMIAD